MRRGIHQMENSGLVLRPDIAFILLAKPLKIYSIRTIFFRDFQAVHDDFIKRHFPRSSASYPRRPKCYMIGDRRYLMIVF